MLLMSIMMLLISGCQSGYLIQYDSAPQSAMVMCGYEQKGYTPLNLYYPKESTKKGYINTVPCKAVWVSGVEAQYQTIVDTVQFPKGIRLFVKNQNVSGEDIRFDYQLKQSKAAASQEAFENLNNTIQNNRSKTTYCNQIGFQTICNTY